MKWMGLGALWLVVAFPMGPAAAGEAVDDFDHSAHQDLFPSCIACHAFASEPGQARMPVAAGCAHCHDGVELDAVVWRQPPIRPTHLRFDHLAHAGAVDAGGDEPLDCTACHTLTLGADRMDVVRTAVGRCMECHGGVAHLALESRCGLCHVALAEAPGLSVETVSRFQAPPSHAEPAFGLGGHGVVLDSLATQALPGEPARCAVCHARDQCTSCHVNAPEVRSIAAMSEDSRSLVHAGTLPAPADHAAGNFLQSHGGSSNQSCATCHTRESCWTCHTSTPEVAAGLPGGGPGRGSGAVTELRAPPSHDAAFRYDHGRQAAVRPAACAACHHRGECLDCHRPGATSVEPRYHPLAFLERHPTDAYARDASCADCHNTGHFCAACHERAGLTKAGRGLLGAGYHDGRAHFLLGHGEAARRNLESCVSCHREADCLACHSAQGGRRFNPHGPEFDAARLRERAPQMCTVCHGAAIPGG